MYNIGSPKKTCSKLRVQVTIAMIFLLSGCAKFERMSLLRSMNTNQLQQQASNGELCHIATQWPSYMSTSIASEIKRRNLGDCSTQHFTCLNMGAGSSPELYTQCRMSLRQQEIQQLQLMQQQEILNEQAAEQRRQNNYNNYIRALEASKPQPRSNTNCITNVVGTTAFTNCY